ncbi:hypothetical protein IJG98_00430 [Candidatus Saccharibacteria bacterium]|nr:hypothetical protein [Candidatus Saccharibacteria bacterium]
MIGQKGFFKANTNANPNLGDAIVSSPAPNFSPSPTPPANFTAPQEKKPLPLKTILIAIAAALIGAGVAVAVILILNKKSDGEHVTVYETETVSDGSQTVAETVEKFDEQISSAKDEAEKIENILSKVGYFIIMEQYDQALAELDSINVGGLSDYDQYRVYSNYASVYSGLKNSTKATEYQKLAESANARDFGNAEGNTN